MEDRTPPPQPSSSSSSSKGKRRTHRRKPRASSKRGRKNRFADVPPAVTSWYPTSLPSFFLFIFYLLSLCLSIDIYAQRYISLSPNKHTPIYSCLHKIYIFYDLCSFFFCSRVSFPRHPHTHIFILPPCHL